MPTNQGSSKIKDQSLSFTSQDSHQGKTRESHRESLRAPTLAPRRQPQGIGFGYRAEDGQQTGRTKAPVLCGELGENHRRSLGKRDRYRCSSGISQHASPRKKSRRSASECSAVHRTYKRGKKAAREASNYTSISRMKLHKHSVSGTKGRWLMATSDKPPSPEQTRDHLSFQDGVDTDCKGADTSGGVVTETGPDQMRISTSQSVRNIKKFQWQGQTWKFQALPFGLSSAPHMFTKLMKPIVALLRKLGLRIVMYLDDMIVARTPEEARQHLATIVKILVAINLDKSITTPTQRLEFLGFALDSRKMTISLPGRKLHALRKLARRMLRDRETAVLDLARLLGTMVAAHPAILPAPLYYCQLERRKLQALKKGLNYQSLVEVTTEMRTELQWWAEEACHHNGRPLKISQWNVCIESDASKMGWGAFSQGKSAGGPWTAEEKEHNINYLELLAAFLALKSFVKTKEVSVLLRLDNITAIAFVNKMGGTHSKQLSDLAVEIGKWCLARRILVDAEHLPGVENTREDWESRHMEVSGDWMLDCQVFEQLNQLLGPFTVDLFAARTNAQLPQYFIILGINPE